MRSVRDEMTREALPMGLAKFIEQNMEAILVEWESFARSLDSSTAVMSSEKLRDHARKMLTAVAADIVKYQSSRQQEEKAKGDAPAKVGPETAASSHGTDRQDTGFSLAQLIAEFRAVRASVLRLWLPTVHKMDESVIHEMVRFNESIDQAIAESVETFSIGLDSTRDTFLGMLGHDLRGPLHIMGMSAAYLSRVDSDPVRRVTAIGRIVRSSAAMQGMVNDLLDFARTRLGGGIPISRKPGDLRAICEEAIHDVRVLYPTCEFCLQAPLAMKGEFDAARLLQVLGNLLNNASQYRTKGTVVSMSAGAEEGLNVIRVQNFGAPIPAASKEAIFKPMLQLAVKEDQVRRAPTSVGLGLFIARKITESHGGSLEVESTKLGSTTFTIRLPSKP